MKTKNTIWMAVFFTIINVLQVNAQNNSNAVYNTASTEPGMENSIFGIHAGAQSINTNQQLPQFGRNVFVGFSAGRNANIITNECARNTFLGYSAGYNPENTSLINGGSDNVFVGNLAGWLNTTGERNVIIKSVRQLVQPWNNITGFENSILGYESGEFISSGMQNSFFGTNSGRRTTTGSNNSFLGHYAGALNETGSSNISVGSVGPSNGSDNILIGRDSGQNCASSTNILIGINSGRSLTTGNNNVAVGTNSGFALTLGGNNLLFGNSAGELITTGNNNMILGTGSGQGLSTGSNNVFLGKVNVGSTDPSNTVIIADNSANQRIYVGNNGYTGIGLGFNQIPQNRLELGSGLTGTMGLRFRGVNNTNFNPTSSSNKRVLTVNGSGDVVLVDDDLGNDWKLTGNAGTNPSTVNGWVSTAVAGTHFLGTTDNHDLVFRRNNVISGLIGANNTGFGFACLSSGNLTGTANTVFGVNAGAALTVASSNTAVGISALGSLSIGNGNTVIGRRAGFNLNGSSANGNVMIGNESGTNLINGGNNVFIGPVTVNTGSTASQAGATAGQTGDDTSGTIILASTAPVSGLPAQRLYIHNNGFTGIGLGNNVIPKNMLEIRSLSTNSSGLRFTNLNSNFYPGASASKFLTVDNQGDVILRDLPASGGATTNTLASSLNTMTSTVNSIVATAPIVSSVVNTISNGTLTTTVNGVASNVVTLPTSNTNSCNLFNCDGTIDTNNATSPNPGLRTVHMENNNLFFDTGSSAFAQGTTGSGRIYIGSATNNFPLLNFIPPVTPANDPVSRYRLLVEGGVLTEHVKVALSNGSDWRDDVFENHYDLMPLKEIEAFVKANKHLPGIESADELVKNGLDLGDMQAKQMGKIEELTLHAIEQEKKLEAQAKEIEELKTLVKALLDKK